MKLHFVLSDLVADEAAAAFAEHARQIRERLPNVEIGHTGGTSVLGVLTSGDVDLQVRTERHSFPSARDVLRELYEPLDPEAWHPDSAYFLAVDASPPVEVSLTVIGTLDDLHHGAAWQRIAANPGLIEEYNALKRAHVDRPMSTTQPSEISFAGTSVCSSGDQARFPPPTSYSTAASTSATPAAAWGEDG